MLAELLQRAKQVASQQPGHADRQVAIARLLEKLGDVDGALDATGKAIQANPKYIEAHRLHARLLAKAGEVEPALNTLQGLVSRGVNWPDLHYDIAELQNGLGRADDARSHLQAAMTLNPRYRKAQTLLRQCA